MLDRLLRPPQKHGQVLGVFAAAVLIIYFPALDNGFLTDDYAALYRVSVEKQVLHKGFFRPLIDVSFWFNWLLSGLNPQGYYLFNIVVHALSCFMVYRVALALPFFRDERQASFAWIAGWLFVCYPFHNESIIWLSGRLSSMAALCGLAGIYLSLRARGPWSWLLPGLLMILGLMAYESIVMLPVMVILLRWRRGDGVHGLVRPVMAWICVFLVYLLARFFTVGTLFARQPGEALVKEGWHRGILQLVKGMGRSVLPPLETSSVLVAAFVVSAVVFVWVHRELWRRQQAEVHGRGAIGAGASGAFMDTYARVLCLFFLSLAPFIAFGVSTRTSEGTRLLYFPSCFVCLLVSAVVFQLVGARRRWVVFCGLAVTGILLIEDNNLLWKRACRGVSFIVEEMKRTGDKDIVLINAPDELEGAPMFRNNFSECLVVNGIDTSRVYVNNFLLRLEYIDIKGDIVADKRGWIAPSSTIVGEGGGKYVIRNQRDGTSRTIDAQSTQVYYWDKSRWKSLILE